MMRAFWEYDQYPFVLSGTVTRITDQGFQTKQYGNYNFSPIFVLPDEDGDAVEAKLEELTNQYRRELAALKANYKRKVLEVAPFCNHLGEI
jgi:hypothetical protein